MLYFLLCGVQVQVPFPNMQNGVLGLGCPQPPAITIGNPNPTVTTTATPPPATGGPGATQPTPPGGGTGVGPCRIVILPTLQVAPGPQCRVLHIPGFPNCAIGLGSIFNFHKIFLIRYGGKNSCTFQNSSGGVLGPGCPVVSGGRITFPTFPQCVILVSQNSLTIGT